MNLKSAIIRVVGENQHHIITQTFAKENFFIVFSVKGRNAADTSRLFASKLEQLDRNKITDAKQFRSALSEIFQKNRHISFTAGLLSNDQIYLLVKGAGQVWLKRLNQVAQLIKGSGTASGKILANDILLLAGGEYFKQEINVLEQVTYEAIGQTLTLDLNKSKANGGALIVTFSTPEKLADKPTAFKSITGFMRVQKKLSIFPKINLPAIKVKPITVIILILVILLAVSVTFGLSRKQIMEKSGALQTQLTDVVHKYEEGVALIELNPVRSRELLAAAKADLQNSLRQNPDPLTKKELEDYLQKVNDGLNLSQREYLINLEPFFDINLVKPGGQGDRMALYKDVCTILDNRNRTIYSLIISSKASRIVYGSDLLVSAKDIAVHGEDIYIMDKDIRQVKQNDLPVIIASDEKWGNIKQLLAFAGNLYLLDTGNHQIWKYMTTEDGSFSSRDEFLLFDTKPDFSQAANMAIDGSVYVALNSRILKFTQGKQDVWQIKGLEKELGDSLNVYTDDTANNLYVLDKANNRVVAVDKDGQYLAQYYWKDPVNITGFVVSEVIKKILLLSGSKIYGIEIK